MNRPADLPEPPELETDLEDVALRCTFSAQLPPDFNAAIQTTCEAAVTAVRQAGHVFEYLDAIDAAAEDLLFLARYLHFFADNRGDGVGRAEIPAAAAVLDAVPRVAQIASDLQAAVTVARRLGSGR